MNQFNNLSELSKDILDITNSKKKEAVQLLQKLISFDTTVEDQGRKGREGPAQKWLAKYLEAKGFEVDVFEPDISKIFVDAHHGRHNQATGGG